MMTPSTATCLLLLLTAQTPATAEPLEVRHVPLAQVPAGAKLVLRAEVAPAWRLEELVAHYRASGEKAFHEVAFERGADGLYAAAIPLSPEQRIPLEYYLSARDTDGAKSVRFASAEAPHPVLIEVGTLTLEREALMEVYGQRRSRVSIVSEFVDYGARTVDGISYQDRYYRMEADYLYRLFTNVGSLRIDSIRIGAGHLRATTPPQGASGSGGLDYGFSEVDVGFSPVFGLGAKLMLGGNETGFALGFGGKLRIGRPRGARAELEGEFMAGLGNAGTVRLAWDTVPRFPMSAAVQVTNVPTGPTGVRLLYNLDYQASESFLIGGQVGYQARVSEGGGLTLGFSASYGW